MAADYAMDASGDNSFFGRFLLRYADEFYLLFRLIFAFIVALHGAQKAFLLWGFPAAYPLGVLVDIAGWVEVVAAVLIGFGILTRLGAGALVVAAVAAYFVVHAGNGVWPHIYPAEGGPGANGGEVTILWFAIAGIIGVLGSRKYGIERLWLKREIL